MAVTKLVEGCFISDLALVSSPEVACGFRYDSNHSEIDKGVRALLLKLHVPKSTKDKSKDKFYFNEGTKCLSK